MWIHMARHSMSGKFVFSSAATKGRRRFRFRGHIAFVYLVLCSVALGVPSVSAQTVGILPPTALHKQEVHDSAIRNIALNGRVLIQRDFLHGLGLAVRVVGVAGESGSAGDESDATVDWIYIGISGFGEAPPQKVYRIGPMYEPSVEALVIENRLPVLYISYGAPGRRERARIVATLDHLSIGLAPNTAVRDSTKKPSNE
jgi:hypothetical protein